MHRPFGHLRDVTTDPFAVSPTAVASQDTLVDQDSTVLDSATTETLNQSVEIFEMFTPRVTMGKHKKKDEDDLFREHDHEVKTDKKEQKGEKGQERAQVRKVREERE